MQETFLIEGTMNSLGKAVPPDAPLGLTPGSRGSAGSQPLCRICLLPPFRLEVLRRH
jgi:hypothetical protein